MHQDLFTMKLSDENITAINESFKNLQTISDLADLVNSVYGILYPDKKIQIRSNQIIYYADRRNKEVRYNTFDILKKNGSKRQIDAPVKSLKRIQRAVNLILSTVYQPTQSATGFVKGKNLLDNAKPHVGKFYLYNVDLKDFFPSIKYGRVKAVLQIPPYNLSEELATIVGNLCCNEGRLPQGAPTSPILSNMVCNRLDRKLTGLAKKHKASYTRYADDLTFSAHTNVFKDEDAFRSDLEKIINEQGFKINNDKTRLQGSGFRQEVTGIIVNNKANLERKKIRNTRSILDKWEKLGYKQANELFKSKKGDKAPELIMHISGMISYMKMIRGRNDLLTQKYEEKFKNLIFKTFINKLEFVNNTLKIWGILGNDKAIAYFNKINTGNIKNSYRLMVKSVGPIRKNELGLNQRWILFEDQYNHLKAGYILFENQYGNLWNFISEKKDLDQTVFPGEIVAIKISKSILSELGVSLNDSIAERIIGQNINVPILNDDSRSMRYNVSTAVIKQLWKLVLSQNN